MENFSFYSPTEFVFGRGAEQQAGRLCREHGAGRVLVVYGQGHVVRSGLLAQVERQLTEAGLPFAELGGVQPNPMDDKVYAGIDAVRREGIDFLLAVGGGSVIDTAKAIAAGALYAGDFWDFYGRGVSVERAVLPKPGPAALATAGSGDVLAGMMASAIAQRSEADVDPALLAAYVCEVHAYAGTLAAERRGSRAVMASDIIDVVGVASDAVDAHVAYPDGPAGE